VFGAGWGLSGICPGPGLMIAASGSAGGLVFVATMSLGMWLSDRLDNRLRSGDDTLPEAAAE
jgi:uncharacterized membrane protein YedE/YeeE